MYDVIYIDAHGDETPRRAARADRKEAAEVAKLAAAERGVGRMMLPGSSKLPNCVCVVPGAARSRLARANRYRPAPCGSAWSAAD